MVRQGHSEEEERRHNNTWEEKGRKGGRERGREGGREGCRKRETEILHSAPRLTSLALLKATINSSISDCASRDFASSSCS